ncbi:MAG: DUF2254 domain-containing protein [Solirubrobacterales bacterium]|nr:DUF2254 domain-containing protein [Solirubrobacterales bacterium]
MTFKERTGVCFRLREAIARSWLIIPCLYLVAALALGRIVPGLVGHGDGSIFGLSMAPESARGVLEAVAGGMITFTGLVVSVAVVVVVFGAGQYTPRLVLRFRRDNVVKNSLGIFIAPAIYALVCLEHISRSGVDREATFTVAVAVLLLVAAVVAFFALVARLLDLLRPRRLYDQLRKGGEHAIDEVYPLAWTEDADAQDEVPVSGGLPVYYRGGEGVLSALDLGRLTEIARRNDVLIEVTWRIGGYARAGAPLFIVYGDDDTVDIASLRKTAVVAEERTLTQDPAFAIRTTVDIAIRALSPAVNDPTTGAQALDTIESLLSRLAFRNLGSGFLRDVEGIVRVAYSAPTWGDLLDLSFTEIRHYGSGSHQITRRMRSLLMILSESCPPPRQKQVNRQLELLDEAIERNFSSASEREIARLPDHIGLGGGHSTSGRSSPGQTPV